MGFHEGAYATVWSVEDKGKWTKVNLSTSRKNRQTDKYETDFSDFVAFVGDAHRAASDLKERDRIKIGGCDSSNSYNKEKKQKYYNFTVFDFESVESKNSGTSVPTRMQPTQAEQESTFLDEDPF